MTRLRRRAWLSDETTVFFLAALACAVIAFFSDDETPFVVVGIACCFLALLLARLTLLDRRIDDLTSVLADDDAAEVDELQGRLDEAELVELWNGRS